MGWRGRGSSSGSELLVDLARSFRVRMPHLMAFDYILIDISEFGYDSDLEFAEALARDVGVGSVPGSSFFKEKENRYVRLHFAKKDETLNEALNRLSDIRNKLRH